MTKLEVFLYEKAKEIMSTWDEPGIYAVSFFVYSNEMVSYRDHSNVSTFTISYNTEEDCGHAERYAEERWNYAFWRQDEWHIIDPEEGNMGMELLFEWYKEQGIDNIGYEGPDTPDGPVGFPELVHLVGRVAHRLQEEGLLRKKFGHPIPILVHDLEYADCTIRATEFANPNGEAADFLAQAWTSEPVSPPPFPDAATLAGDFLKDPNKLQHLIAASPGLSPDYVMDMLKKLSGR